MNREKETVAKREAPGSEKRPMQGRQLDGSAEWSMRGRGPFVPSGEVAGARAC
jgi:hypothetical protein